MHRLRRIFSLTYSGFMIGYTAALTLGASVWLEMRINVALLIPVCSLAAMLVSFWGDRSPKWLWLMPQAAAILTLFALYGADLGASKVIPGILLREGFGLGLLSLTQVNLVLLTVILLGNSLWLYSVLKR